ncbi:MAG: rod shape-determining protein MreC [Solirubrobacterales bacterium]
MYRKQVRRRRAVLALLVISSFVLLTITYGQGSGGFQRGVSTVFGPLQNIADRALKPARDLVNWVDQTFDARGENDRLHTEVQQLRRQVAASQAAVEENAQLRKLVALKADIPSGYQTVTGRVIARSPTIWYASVTIDAGSSDGVRTDDPVINGDGLVGSVASATASTAQVRLITDPVSAVTGKVVPSGVQGIIRPEIGNPEDLTLGFLDSMQRIGKGQTVVTAGWRGPGISSRFPPNIPVGRITEASIAEREASQTVHMRPFADMRRLDVLQVLTGGSR